jgi:protein TonB
VPAPKAKPAPQAKATTPETERREQPAPGGLLTASAPSSATSSAAPPRAKTRGLDEMVVPLEHATETTHVGPVELVVAPPPAVTADPAPARATEPAPLRAVEHPQPQFPAAAAKDGIQEGRVVAQLTVNSDGSVGRIEIVDAQPRSVFDKEVRRALAAWRYEAPGQPRKTTVEFVFKLEQ